MTVKLQYRGHCQCCGREQAVVSGVMSNHGYTVADGWFKGTCPGHNHAPIEVDRSCADKIIAAVRRDVAMLEQHASALESGTVTPAVASGGRHMIDGKFVETTVPYADATPWDKKHALQTAIWSTRNRAASGKSFATMLEAQCDKYHGKDLVVAVKPQPAQKITAGDQCVINGVVHTAKYQDGARVYWTRLQSNGKQLTGWTGSRAWRALPQV